jgi:hypothetical protein
MANVGSVRAGYSATKVFIIAGSRMASTEDIHHQVHTSSLPMLPYSSRAMLVWALGMLLPIFSTRSCPYASPFNFTVRQPSPVGRNKYESRPSFQSSNLIKLAIFCKMGWSIPYFISGGEQAQIWLMDGKFRK